MLTPDTVLQSRYRIIRQLGQGGMGAVYEAVDERLDSTVALKETLFADERLRKQFEREARLLARMHHPALPRVSDHFAEGDGQFLIMQYIAGDDLAAMIASKHGPFPLHQVLTWATQLLDALDYLHTQDPQIIHRDIKPQNLKLTSRGQIILLDFGLAKGQIGEFSRVTTSASIFGYTPNYAPLEQIQGLGTDPRSDIYSLAATLYHLITGVKPPDALTRAAALVNSQPDPLSPANEVNPAVSVGLAAVLARAMAQSRDQRYPTAAEMTKALHIIGQANTSLEKSEAQTVLVAPPVQPTHIATAPTQAAAKKATVITGETTVIRSPKAKLGRAPWAIAAGVILLLGAGVFYAYQRRNTVSNPSSSPVPINKVEVQASPAADSQPVQSSTPAVEESKSQPEAQPAKTAEQTSRKESSTRNRTATTKKDPTTVPTLETPEIEVPEVRTEVYPNSARPGVHPPLTPQRPERNAGGATIKMQDGTVLRTARDGTRIVIAPDGTRTVIAPDGARRVIPFRDRLQRRRRP